jgi:hypothetical protein
MAGRAAADPGGTSSAGDADGAGDPGGVGGVGGTARRIAASPSAQVQLRLRGRAQRPNKSLRAAWVIAATQGWVMRRSTEMA